MKATAKSAPVELLNWEGVQKAIRRNMANLGYAAKPYAQAILQMDAPTANYGLDDGKGICCYFLGNVQGWRGDEARQVKASIKKLAGIR
jgi:hypothetical protein